MEPNCPGMRRLILVLMSNVCYLTVISIFMVTWWLLLVTKWLLVVTARYGLLLLVPTFSMKGYRAIFPTKKNFMTDVFLRTFSKFSEKLLS